MNWTDLMWTFIAMMFYISGPLGTIFVFATALQAFKSFWKS